MWGEDGAPPDFLIEVRAGGPAGGCHTNPGQLCRWPEAHGRGSEPQTAVALGRRGWRSLFLTDGRGMWKEEITGDGQGPGRWDHHPLSGDGAPGEHAGDSELLQSLICGSADQLAFSGTKRNAFSNRWRLRLDKEPLAVTSPRLHRCCPARRPGPLPTRPSSPRLAREALSSRCVSSGCFSLVPWISLLIPSSVQWCLVILPP